MQNIRASIANLTREIPCSTTTKNFHWLEKESFSFEQLVSPDKIIFPFLHIKLGLFQKFVKTLNPVGEIVKYLQDKFKKSEAKTLNGIFNGPEFAGKGSVTFMQIASQKCF